MAFGFFKRKQERRKLDAFIVAEALTTSLAHQHAIGMPEHFVRLGLGTIMMEGNQQNPKNIHVFVVRPEEGEDLSLERTHDGFQASNVWMASMIHEMLCWGSPDVARLGGVLSRHQHKIVTYAATMDGDTLELVIMKVKL